AVRFDFPGDQVRSFRSQVRRELVVRPQLQPVRPVGHDHVGLLGHGIARPAPPHLPAWFEAPGHVQLEVPVALALRDKRVPDLVRRCVDMNVPRAVRHEASRPTVCTSLTPSIFSIRRDSWASESISTVAETTAVLSSWTFTSSADMFTRFSATTVAMSRSRPCRSNTSILIATG